MANPSNEAIDFNEERLAFYSHLGIAITQWAQVEFALAWVVALCFKKQHAQTAVDGFMSIENIRAKLQYVDTVIARLELSPKRKEEWAELSKRASGLAKKRARLAHGWVMNYPENPSGKRVALNRMRPDVNPRDRSQPDAIYLRDVVSYRLEFVALFVALENFSDRVLGQATQLPKSQEQPQRPPILSKLRRELYAFAARPPKS